MPISTWCCANDTEIIVEICIALQQILTVLLLHKPETPSGQTGRSPSRITYGLNPWVTCREAEGHRPPEKEERNRSIVVTVAELLLILLAVLSASELFCYDGNN